MATYNVTQNNHTIEGIRQTIGQSNKSIHSLICPGSIFGLFVFGNEEFCTFAPGKYTATDYDLVQAFYFLLVDVHFIRCRKKFHYHQFPDIDAGRGINEAGETFTGHNGLAEQLDALTLGSYTKTFFTGIGASGNFGALQQSFTVTNKPERFLSYQNINRIPARNQPGLSESHLAQIAEVNNLDEPKVLEMDNIINNTNTKYFFSVSSKPFATIAVTSGESESSASQATFNVAKFDPTEFCAGGECTEEGDNTTSEHINVSTEGPDKLIINFYGQMSATFGNRTFEPLAEDAEAPEEALTGLWNSAPNADLYEAHKFQSKSELKTAISEWATDDEAALLKWGQIKYWDITAVTDFSDLFDGNVGTESSPLSFDLSNWNTTGVTNMSGMFKGCTYINTLGDISNWNTGNVDNMSGMFSGVKFLNYVDIGKWNVSNVIDMSHMFDGGTTNANYMNNYSAFTLENWNVSKVQNMSYMFANNAFIRPNVSKWNVGNVTSMESMFESFGGPYSATVDGSTVYFDETITLDVTRWNTSKVTTMYKMFKDVVRDIDLVDVYNWNFKSITNITYMFHTDASYDYWWEKSGVPMGVDGWMFPSTISSDLTQWPGIPQNYDSTDASFFSGPNRNWEGHLYGFDSLDEDIYDVTNIIEPAKKGETVLQIASAEQYKFPVGTEITIDGHLPISELAKVKAHGSLVLESPLIHDHDINALIVVSTLPVEETESSPDEVEQTQEEETPTNVNGYWIKDTTSEYPSENVYWHLQTRPIYPVTQTPTLYPLTDETGTHSIRSWGNINYDYTNHLFDGASLNFDGVDDNMSGPSVSYLHTGESDFTFEFWIRMSDFTKARNIFGNNGFYADAEVGFQLWINTDKSIQFGMFVGEVGKAFRSFKSSSNTINSSTWHHIAITFNSTSKTLSLFVDGSKQTTNDTPYGDTDATNESPWGAALIGHGSYGHLEVKPYDFFKGNLQDLRITTEEVYTSNFAKPTRLL